MRSENGVVLWFRHGLRLHDNPALEAALHRDPSQPKVQLLPIFIFDGETAGTKICGFNRFQFLLECLRDIDLQLRQWGSRLHVFRGDPIQVLAGLQRSLGFRKLCFEQDCEPIWKKRDMRVKEWCDDHDVEWVERVGHTLYDPYEIIRINGGVPPVTFNMFTHLTEECLPPPPRPLPDVDFSQVSFAQLPDSLVSACYFKDFPTVQDFGLENDGSFCKVYVGGERIALEQLEKRMVTEKAAYRVGSFLPNRRDPDILCPPKSLSPDLRFGSLSIRKFYWSCIDAYQDVKKSQTDKEVKAPQVIVVQLLWREFFYTMSVNNDFYSEMEKNEICINIPWYPAAENPQMTAFENGTTGFPLIDAGMRQLKREGWVHHIIRNVMASFLTRGDLWISWEEGLRIYFHYLLDADWSVCAGNWMWVSSSAFEQVLNCSNCIDPGTFARRMDPWGQYVKRYLPELASLPVEYLYEPWEAPFEVQVQSGCIIGKDYPERIVIHEEVSKKNAMKMQEIKMDLLKQLHEKPRHCGPSNEEEIRQFMGFAEDCNHSFHGRAM